MTTPAPLAVDVFCGDGGWTDGLIAAGYDVIGFDIVRYPNYRGRLVLQDARTIDGRRLSRAALIVASPPCQEFSRLDQPWTRRRNPPAPSLELVEAAWRIAREAGAPFLLENVRGAQAFIGRATAHYGPFYLWGDVPPILPYFERTRDKQSYGSAHRHLRARVPFALAKYIGEAFRPTQNGKPAAKTLPARSVFAYDDPVKAKGAACHGAPILLSKGVMTDGDSPLRHP